jgi:squalene cyclase
MQPGSPISPSPRGSRSVVEPSLPAIPTVSACIERATAHLLARQRQDGSWDEPCDGGPASTANAMVALAKVSALDEDTRRRCIETLLRAQRSDGGFESYPGEGASELGASASALAAFAMCHQDDPRARRAEQRARGFIETRGGLDAVVRRLGAGDMAALFLVAAGVLDGVKLPRIPSRWIGSRRARAWVERYVHGGAALVTGSIAAIRARSVATVPASLARAVIDVHDEYQNPAGGFVNIVPHSAVALLTLDAVGLPRDEDRVARAAQFLLGEFEREGDERGWFPVFHSSVWTSALVLRALERSASQSARPALVAGASWLVRAQSRSPQARANQRTPRAVREGGYGFQIHNERMTDSDDTAVALDALASLIDTPALDDHPALREELRGASRRALAFLFAMNNKDGGWPAFVHGLPSKPPGPIMTEPLDLWPTTPRDLLRILRTPLYAFGDPSTEDVTARVLRALAAHGARSPHPFAERGVAFLRAQQQPDGSFWGRWSANYVWATAHAILGLRAAGLGVDDPCLQRSIAWLLSKQNRDGGFGDDVASYRDPSLAGVGPSMPAVTALALEALVAMNLARSRAAVSAAEYLVRTQAADGAWPDEGHRQVVIPPNTFYRYGGASRFQPLEALIAYRDAATREGSR